MVAKNQKFGSELEDVRNRPKRRPARVSDAIRNEIALLLLRKIKDPRLASITLSKVAVSDDLRTARIYYTVYNRDSAAEAQIGLQKAMGFIRSHLASVLSLRYVPKLIFQLDENPEYLENLEQIFQEIENEDEPTD